MRKSARKRRALLPAEGQLRVDGDLGVYPLFVARVLAGDRVEVHRELALLKRVLAEDPHVPVLDLDDVVAGAGVAAQARRRGGPRVHDEHVLELPRVRDVLVPGEHQVRAHLLQKLEHISGVEDDVALAARAGDRDQVVVDDEDLEPLIYPAERLADEPVVLAPDPPVVEVWLRGVNPHHYGVFEVYARVPLPEEPLEVDVADVARVVVAGNDHYVLAPKAPDVLRRHLELLAV